MERFDGGSLGDTRVKVAANVVDFPGVFFIFFELLNEGEGGSKMGTGKKNLFCFFH